MSIHSTAIVAHGAELDTDVEIGPYVVIGPRVRIGRGTTVGPHAVIEGNTTIGRNNRIFQFAAIGAVPQDLKFSGEETRLEIGDENQIREFATIHLGTLGGGGLTKVGSGSLFMAYSHVAHDAIVGDRCVIANCGSLAGHVILEDDVKIGGLAALHQFTRVGRHAFVAAGAIVTQDVPPYCIVQGDRATLAGLNTVGLTRAGIAPEALSRIKSAYKTLFRTQLGLHEAVTRVRAEYGGNLEIDHLLAFLEGSTRGSVRGPR
ncbi:MAG: acyl-ACP--UDP-N-acetylglucosamine O-acyltransferase [Myxococcales bacterium]|jgi:UDP-N-acetylglucosamine acyltransferase|nr:acyl-ACP--UDP-N-acetylglucosamine O-acyltransferase [Myxococcales bacterium]